MRRQMVLSGAQPGGPHTPTAIRSKNSILIGGIVSTREKA